MVRLSEIGHPQGLAGIGDRDLNHAFKNMPIAGEMV
jgi:hypothetical protein